jgi:hypothetical protein
MLTDSLVRPTKSREVLFSETDPAQEREAH